MFIRVLLSLIIISTQLQCFAQKSPILDNRKFVLKTTVTDIPAQELLPIGFEYVIGKRVGLTFEIGIPVPGAAKIDTLVYTGNVKSDIRYGGDARFYFQKQKLRRTNIGIQGFLGLSVSHRVTNRIVRDGEIITGAGYYYYYPYGDIKRTETKMNIITGFLLPIIKGFGLSFQTGLGVRRIAQNFNNIPELTRSSWYSKKFYTPLLERDSHKLYNDNDYYISFPIAIKVFYRF